MCGRGPLGQHPVCSRHPTCTQGRGAARSGAVAGQQCPRGGQGATPATDQGRRLCLSLCSTPSRVARPTPSQLVEPAATTLIVCGTRGMGALASLVVGSTAQAILAASLAPCLVIRSCVAETFGPPPPVATPPPPPRVVVIAVDASPSGAALCRWAAASVVRQ